MTLKPTILVAHPSDELYGADRVLLESIDALKKKFTVEVWLPNDISYPDKQLFYALQARGIKVSYQPLPVLRRKYLSVFGLIATGVRAIQITAILVRHKSDLVYINTTALAMVAPLARLAKKKSVLHVHEYLGNRIGSLLIKMAESSSRAIAVSQAITAPFSPRLLAITEVVYNGFDLPEASSSSAVGDRRKYLLASRWNSWKGHREFLQAWDSLPRPPGELRILGGPPLAGEGVDVPGIVGSMKHRASVSIVGEIEDVRSEIEESDIVIVPSILPDPLPTIAIEALAAGTPVLASSTGGLPEIVQDGVSGWIVSAEGGQGAWREKLLESERADLRGMAAVCRNRYESLFTKNRYDADILRIVSLIVKREV